MNRKYSGRTHIPRRRPARGNSRYSWLALLLAEIYSFAGLFMSMSNLTKTFYPITALLGVAGYYETTPINLIESTIVLLLCGCFSVFILVWHRRNGKGDNAHGK